MQVNPYLNFDGNCAEAVRFYAEVLGGKNLSSGIRPWPIR
jgi:uncharacterized glyoxalase superfamily protein PhnB